MASTPSWWSSNRRSTLCRWVWIPQRLLTNLGIKTVHLVINRVRTESDLGRVLGYVDQLGAPQFDSVTQVPYDEMVLINEPAVDALLGGSAMAEAVGELCTHVLSSARRVSVSVS